MLKTVKTNASLKKVVRNGSGAEQNAGVDIKMLFEKTETSVPYQKDEMEIAKRIFVREYKKKYGLNENAIWFVIL